MKRAHCCSKASNTRRRVCVEMAELTVSTINTASIVNTVSTVSIVSTL